MPRLAMNDLNEQTEWVWKSVEQQQNSWVVRRTKNLKL